MSKRVNELKHVFINTYTHQRIYTFSLESGIRQLSKVLYKSGLFLQNKANLGRAQIGVSSFLTSK